MAMALLARWRDKPHQSWRNPSTPTRAVPLRVEQLETRTCPSPIFHEFNPTTAYTYPQVELKGWVTDSDPGTLLVSFSGSGISTSVTLSSYGGTFDIFANATSLGTVTIVATNQSTNKSNWATVPITDHPPVISNFQASDKGGHYWTFTGQVTNDKNVAGLVVTLGGLPSLKGVTATVNSQGWFSVTVQLQAGEDGTATAQTADLWGVASNIAWTIVRGN